MPVEETVFKLSLDLALQLLGASALLGFGWTVGCKFAARLFVNGK